MTTIDRVRGFVQGGSVIVVASTLVVGAMATDAGAISEPGLSSEQPAPPEPSMVEGTVLPADLMADAADQAKLTQVKREERARALAQRSSGEMFTPTRRYTYSAVFGQAGGWSSGHHTGLDFVAASGTPVMSALAGKVVEAGWDGAYGHRIIVRHDMGIETLYAHLSSASVDVGDRVTRGQRIGAIGVTGNTSGPHLHFEVIKKGTQRDPQDYL